MHAKGVQDEASKAQADASQADHYRLQNPLLSSSEMTSPKRNLRYSAAGRMHDKIRKYRSYISNRSAFSPNHGRNDHDSLDVSNIGQQNDHGNALRTGQGATGSGDERHSSARAMTSVCTSVGVATARSAQARRLGAMSLHQ